MKSYHRRNLMTFQSSSPSIEPPPPSSSEANEDELLVSSSSSFELDMDELEVMRRDIERLKAEALVRVNLLADKVNGMEVIAEETVKSPEERVKKEDGLSRRSVGVPPKPVNSITDAVPRSRPSFQQPLSSYSNKNEKDLLVGTDWRVLFNVGREPGTWMPKTWGVSGERLLVNLEVVFSDEQLYEREDFLGSIGDSRILKILNNEITLGPSVNEGSRTFKVNNGGWRIAKGQGPMGTDVLRFYIECGHEIRHQGGDVYVPAGRIYATCGYFPLNHPRSWEKADLERQLEELGERRAAKEEEMRMESLLSIKRWSIYREVVQMTIDGQSLMSRLNDARVRDPDMNLLRLSKDGDVGLTREGGICCKVQKGVGYEVCVISTNFFSLFNLYLFLLFAVPYIGKIQY